MASNSETLVSPGLFTSEIDDTQLAAAIANIGGVVVAPFPQGPGFMPTVIKSEADLYSVFGEPDGIYYGPYTAQQYIRQQGQVTICRVGGLGGYTQDGVLFMTAVPGVTTRNVETGSFVGTSIGTTITYISPSNFTINGVLSATFTNGEYSGQTIVVGSFVAQSSGSLVNSTGSTFVSGPVTAYLTGSSLPNRPGIDSIIAYATASVVQVNSCASQVTWTGYISGSYGAFNTSSWSSSSISSQDPCGNITSSTGRDEEVLAVFANTALDRGQLLLGFSGSTIIGTDNTIGADYTLTLNYPADQSIGSQSGSYGYYSFSIDENSPAYITNVFGKNPQAGYVAVPAGAKIEAAYLQSFFPDKMNTIYEQMLASGSWKVQLSARNTAMVFTDGISPTVGNSAFDLTNAYTPWIQSQAVANWAGSTGGTGSYHYQLFQFFTITDGTNANQLYKIDINTIRSPGSISGTDYGSFNVYIRDFADTDANPDILEAYSNVNLNPDDANYIARRIGDSYSYIDFTGKIQQFGNYNNVSQLVYVQMATSPWPVTAIPYGFAPYAAPVGGDYAVLGKIPAMAYTNASAYSEQPGRYASGVLFDPAPSSADSILAALYPSGSASGPEIDNLAYFAPVPQGSAATSNVVYDLFVNAGVTPNYVPANETTNVQMRRFILGFQGGFDGQSPSKPILIGNDILPTNTQGLDCSTSVSYGSLAYAQCIDALSNQDDWDINLITVPGIEFEDHPSVVEDVIAMVEGRGDAFYIADLSPNQLAGVSSQENVVQIASQIDSNYAAAYYPWIKILDTNSNKVILTPPSVPMMAVYAANDKVAAEWFAPAGLNRGGIPAAVQVADRLDQADRDRLYTGKVNPIASFPGQGIVAWGQKTLQTEDTLLNRINIRRLLIAVKKFIASSSRFLVFEQGNQATMNRFLAIANPYLESVQQRAGLYAFKVTMDSSNNSPDTLDQNILNGNIQIQPTTAIEYINLTFTLEPQGATFK
jgi:hypothetical protein